MKDIAGRVLGIRLRRPNGFKLAVTGSREGLFIPGLDNQANETSPLLICEGPTDTAALLDMGFSHVAGRPSCTGGVKLLVELVRSRGRPEVVVVADADKPGRRGAENLASVLLVYTPAVRIIQPPVGQKDARDWLRAGGTRDDVEEVIRATEPRHLVIRARTTDCREGGRS
jgi:DNA primase